MRCDEIITEAQLTPGQVKAIKVKIEGYQDEIRKLNRQKMQLDDRFKYQDYPDDPELKDKIEKYIEAYTNAIEKAKAELTDKEDNRGFNNLITGIKKNCSDIVDFYRANRMFFYTGFKNAADAPALYAKSPSKIIVPDFYNSRNFAEVADMIEDYYDFASFDHAILANSYYPNTTSDNRKPYMIFPLNGFKYFYTKRRINLTIREQEITKLFDKDLVFEGWRKFVSDPDMLAKFIDAGAGISEFDQGSVRWYGGFMGEDNYKSQLMAIDTLAEKGELDIDWDRMGNWRSWVTKESFDAVFNIDNQSLKFPAGQEVDIVFNTPAIYAIEQKYVQQVRSALGIGNY